MKNFLLFKFEKLHLRVSHNQSAFFMNILGSPQRKTVGSNCRVKQGKPMMQVKMDVVQNTEIYESTNG